MQMLLYNLPEALTSTGGGRKVKLI